jgi:VanZ family protein
MLKALILFSILSFNLLCHGQRNDTTLKIRNTSIIIGSSSVMGFTLLHQVWYKEYQNSKFHLYNDSKNWLQMDKLGHVYTANKLSHLFYNTYSRTGIKPAKAALIGSSLGLGFQTTIEVMDGFSSGWGFSWSDMAANTVGSLSFLSQQLLWQEEKLILKFSYHPTEYAELRPEVLGSNFSERLLKDYNGQTYWLSFSPNIIFKKVPNWACLSLGYSVNAKLVGDKENYYDPIEGKNFFSNRQYLLSLDIDFSKLPIKKVWLKKIVKQFNYLKIPFPALMIQNQGASLKGIYF